MNIRNSGENIETANDNKKKQTLSSSTFLSAFTREYVDKLPPTDKNKLIEEVMTQETLSGTLAAKGLMEFKASEEKYNDIDISDAQINVYTLRKQLAKGYISIQKSRENLEQHILTQYDISSKDYQNKLFPAVKNLSEKELMRYIANDYELQKFIKTQLGTENLSPRVKFDILDGISEVQIQNRLRSIPEGGEKSELLIILTKIQNGGIPRDDEVRAIVESPLLDAMQQLNFVHTFVPYITLQQAVDMGLKTETQAETIRNKYINDLLADKNLEAIRIDEIKNQLGNNDIEVRTKDLVQSGPDAIKISQEIGFQNFVESLTGAKQDTLDQVRLKGPQNFSDMVILLGEMSSARGNTYQNIQLFSSGNIIKFSKKQRDGDVSTDYVEIIDFDDTKREFKFKPVGNEVINLKNPGEVQSIAYHDFIESLKADQNTSFEAISKDAIKTKIKKGEIQASDLTNLSADDFSGEENAGRRQSMKDYKMSELQKELGELQSQISSIDDEKKKKEIQDLIEKKEKEISDFTGREITNEESAELSNIKDFLEKLDEVDPKGKMLGFKKGVSFQFGKRMGEGDFGTYTLMSGQPDYEDWTVSFYSEANGGKPEKINLNDFYEGFKEKEATRIKSITSPEELLSENEGFKNHEFKDGEIIAKNAEDGNGKSEDRVVEYLGSSKNKTILKIVSLSGGYVEVLQGEREHVKLSKKEDDKGDKKDSLKLSKDSQKWTLDELHRFINQESLEPDWKIGKSMTITPQDQQNPIKKGFKWNAWSIHEIIAGSKTVIEGITESLHQGSHVKSAHAALAMGAFLPQELKEDLTSKVEAAESEEMDKALKQLGAVDSWMAIERIRKWLTNANTSESKKEAGLLFMLEKYGHLTAKNAGKDGGLYQFRGKFLWYEAFGGKINDALFNKTKEEAENDGQVFSEEKLMHMLMKKQCGHHGFNGIHRRSRLHKEYENKWKSGVSAEFEKGEKDAGNFRNADTMVREGMSEATGGTTSNAFGWAKKAVDRGGSLEAMMHIPSAILLSGACFDLDQVTYNKVKGFWDGEGQPVIAFRMFASKGLMETYNETIYELSKEIQKAYPQFDGIEGEAKKLLELSQTRKGPEKDRLNLASEFWKKYGEVLSRALNISLQGDEKYGATDDVIRRKKDENSVFGTYYNTVRNAVGEGNSFKSDFVDDWAGETGIYGLNPYAISLKYLTMDQGGGFREKSIAPKIWGHYVDDINATSRKIMIPGSALDSLENRMAQEEHVAELLQDITGAFYEMGGLRPDYIFGLNKPTSTVGRELNKWGFDLERDLGLVASADILSGVYKEKFKKVSQKILDGGGGGESKAPSVLIKNIQEQTAANLNKTPRE